MEDIVVETLDFLLMKVFYVNRKYVSFCFAGNAWQTLSLCSCFITHYSPRLHFPSGDDDTGDRKYVSLLNNFSQSHPELTGNKNHQQRTKQLQVWNWTDQPADLKWLSEASCWSNTCLQLTTKCTSSYDKLVCQLFCRRAAEETVKPRQGARQKDERRTDTEEQTNQEQKHLCRYQETNEIVSIRVISDSKSDFFKKRNLMYLHINRLAVSNLLNASDVGI